MDQTEKESSGGPPAVALRYLAAIFTAAAFVGGAGWLLQRRSKRRKAKADRDADDADEEGSED